uniref:Uncharacterized protein n=1 Tax=Avena sativa TaxID=4498 RepID=A0ACD5VK73_AVESA
MTRREAPPGPSMETVILPRLAEISAAEDPLRWALVVFVSGHRSHVSLIEARAAVAVQVPRAEDNFTLHRSWPADFLLVCSSRRVRDDVLAAGVIDGRGFSLRFSPWNRQLQAVRRPLRFRAHFELTGIPAHAWNRTTVMALLGSAAWVERLGAATASREDLGHFRVIAWIDNPNQLPSEKALLIEEPDDRMEEDEGLVLPGDALIPLEKLMLRYVVKIRLVRAEDMSAPGPSSGDDGSDDDGDLGSGGRDRGRGGRDDGPSERPRGRSDARMPFPGQLDGCGEVPQRRRQPDVCWGGSRRIAIDAPLEVEPWPEVEGEDVQEDDWDDDGGEAHLDRLSFGRRALEPPAPVSRPFEQAPNVAAPRGKHVVGEAGEEAESRGTVVGPVFACGVESRPSDIFPGREETAPKGTGVGPLFACGVSSPYTPVDRQLALTGTFRSPIDGLGSTDVGVEEDLVAPLFSLLTKTKPHVDLAAREVFEPDARACVTPCPHQGEACQLESPGLLPSLSDTSGDTCWAAASGQTESPRSVFDMLDVFSVHLSPADGGSDQLHGPRAMGPGSTPVGAQGSDAFRDACKMPINSILSRPVAKRSRKKKYSGPVRRSGRLRGRFAAGTPIRQQQRTLITRLGIAREGEVIGDEALDAYLDLFARPLQQQHIDVVLRLFGWMPEALPLLDDAPVECLI